MIYQNLDKEHYYNEIISNVTFEGQYTGYSFFRCVFNECLFVNATFIDCDMRLGGVSDSCAFYGCKIVDSRVYIHAWERHDVVWHDQTYMPNKYVGRQPLHYDREKHWLIVNDEKKAKLREYAKRYREKKKLR